MASAGRPRNRPAGRRFPASVPPGPGPLLSAGTLRRLPDALAAISDLTPGNDWAESDHLPGPPSPSTAGTAEARVQLPAAGGRSIEASSPRSKRRSAPRAPCAGHRRAPVSTPGRRQRVFAASTPGPGGIEERKHRADPDLGTATTVGPGFDPSSCPWCTPAPPATARMRALGSQPRSDDSLPLGDRVRPAAQRTAAGVNASSGNSCWSVSFSPGSISLTVRG